MERFADIVDAADRLSSDDQIALVEILQHRLAEQGRREIVADVVDARSEYRRGQLKPGTANSIMDDIRNEP